jgi:molybdopterin molybdotransferase
MSKAPLMSLESALEQVLLQARAQGLSTETISTFDGLGRVLSVPLVSPIDVPSQDNTAMDGYAVRSEDLAKGWGQVGQELKVTQRIPAGLTGQALRSGEAARIFTGAWIPEGATAVVMQEDAVLSENGGLKIDKPVTHGQWIRRRGEDVHQGEIVIHQGERLTAAALGLAASVGAAHLEVSRKPRVALFSTGDELVMPGEVLPAEMKPGSIYNSNRFFLKAMLAQLGCEVEDHGIVPDNRLATIEALQKAAQHCDVILSSGGVSVGEEDHVKPAVQSLGALNLWSLSMKPGKPFALGHMDVQASTSGIDQSKTVHFIGLPGNPVSSYVTFNVLVRPFLLALQGAKNVEPHAYALQAHFDLNKSDVRREFLRVKLNSQGGLDLFQNQSSGVLTSCVWADGLVDNPAHHVIKRGDWVRFLPFSEMSQ